MTSAIRTTLILIVSPVLLVTLASSAQAQNTTPPTPVIQVSGESRITLLPDQAWATVSLETRDGRAPEARRLGAVAMTSVFAKLKETGLAADAIKTTGFSLHPEFEYANGRQRAKGFVLSNQVQVRIDDVAKVAEVLDAVGALALSSSSTVSITGLRFDLKDRASVERDALKQAVEDAMARARSMAAGGKAAIVRVLRIDERITGQQIDSLVMQDRMTMARAGGGAVATPIAPSEVEIRAQVTVTVEIR